MADENKHILTVRALITYGGKLLVVRRSKTGKRAGLYEVPGGMVDPGENLEAAMRREVKEETGLDLKNIQFRETSSYQYEKELRLSGIFEAEAVSDRVSLSSEHDDFKWIDAGNYDKLNLEQHYRGYLKDYFRKANANHKIDVENTIKNHSKLIIYTDGGSRGNPGPSASGYVILTTDGSILEEGGEYLGITTNNQAEYQAVQHALEAVKKFQPKKLKLLIDSQLVVNQMNGVYKVKNRDLIPIHEVITQLIGGFQEVVFEHVRREKNTLADGMVNQVLDAHTS